MHIIDAHSDIFTDVAVKRAQGRRKVFATDFLPRLQGAGIAGAVLVAWVEPAYAADPARRLAEVLAYADDDLAESGDAFRVVLDAEGLADAERDGAFFVVRGIEGLSGLPGCADRLYELFDRGIRHVGLTWNEANGFASGVDCREPMRGLTAEGRKAVAVMERLGMLIDVSHLNEKSFWDVCEAAVGPVVASHSNARRLCYADRNLTDDQIRAIGQKRGVIGMNAWNSFVRKEAPDAEALADHLDYVVQMIGVDHVGFGFDFSDYLAPDVASTVRAGASTGTKATPKVTSGIARCEDAPAFVDLLARRGYREADIEKLAYGNWRRALGQALPKR